MKTKILFLPLIIIFFISSFKVSAQAVNAQDSLALVDLYNSTNGTGWINHSNWLTTSPVSTWYGITVANGRVTQISLNRNKLVGILPSSLGNISTLFIMSLEDNHLSGTLPASVGSLPSLLFFSVMYNDLSGDIPSSFTNFKMSSTLNLSYNRFTFSGMEGLITAAITKPFTFIYFPQGDISVSRNGNILSVTAGGTLSRNTYQWYKDGTTFTSKVGDSTLTITTEAHYTVSVTNTNLSFTALILLIHWIHWRLLIFIITLMALAG